MRLFIVAAFSLYFVIQTQCVENLASFQSRLAQFPHLHQDDPPPTPPPQHKPIHIPSSRRYSEQAFIGTHDCAAIRTAENNWSLSGNQYFNVSVQLESGIRFFQAQGHRDPNGTPNIRLCHFNCALMDGGSLQSHLSTIKLFLDTHPTEIVTLLFVNVDVPLSHWMKAYIDTDFDTISYTPPPHLRNGRMGINDWPTLAQMHATNKRAVTFLASGADQSIAPFLLPEFDYVFETNFLIDHPDEYSCRPSRPRPTPTPSGLPPGGNYVPDKLSLVNHFLYAKLWGFRYPNASFAATTNAARFEEGMLGEHAVRCREIYGRRPNFLLVDFWNEGDVFDVEDGLNLN